jgi:hypothetical protein
LRASGKIGLTIGGKVENGNWAKDLKFFLTWIVVKKEFPGHTMPKNSDKIIKNDHFKANFKLV